MPKKKLVCCSFCGKSQAEVSRIIAGPDSIYICNYCVGVCSAIMDRESGATKAPPPPVLTKNANDAERVLFMLRELRKDEIITEAEYRTKARLLVNLDATSKDRQHVFPESPTNKKPVAKKRARNAKG